MNYANSQEIARALEPVLEDAALAQQLAAHARPAVATGANGCEMAVKQVLTDFFLSEVGIN